MEFVKLVDTPDKPVMISEFWRRYDRENT
jgi:hypothetical protein